MTPQPRRRALRVLLTGAALALSACGIDRVDPSGQQVLLWHQLTGPGAAILDTLMGEFNRTNDHGVRVRGEYAGNFDEIYLKVREAIRTEAALPQLVVAYRNQAADYYRAGALVDLAPYMDSPRWGLTDSARADYLPMLLEQDRHEGAQLALRPHFSLELLYYNADWLAELSHPRPPADWTTFAQLCLQARKQPYSRADSLGACVGLALQRDASRFASMVFSRGGDLMNTWQMAYTFYTPEMRESLALLRELKGAGALRILDDREQDIELFAAGQALFVMHSSSGLPAFQSAVAAAKGFQMGVAAVPHDGSTPIHNIYGGSLAVLKSTKAQQLASWLFLKWFTEPYAQNRWVQGSNYFPVRTSAAPGLAAYFRTGFQMLGSGRSEPGVGGYPKVRSLMVSAALAIIDGADMGQTLSLLQGDADRTLPR